MRIIDSNKDFYDFYQGIYRDDSLTFDRRDSYNLSKDEFALRFRQKEYGYYRWNRDEDKVKDVLLQVCNNFWLFALTITKANDFGDCMDYRLELVAKWKDYSLPRELIKLSHIRFFRIKEASKKIEAIRIGEYKTETVFNSFYIYKSQGIKAVVEEKHIPILQYIGIASLVDPLDIYLAFEEYFSQEKTKEERSESVGLTNDDKVTNHGFDLKNSFRGK